MDGIRRVDGAVELPALVRGWLRDPRLEPGTVYNIDASRVIARLDGASGAHNDIGHPELSWLAWNAARAGAR